MMTEQEFSQWCAQIGSTPKGIELQRLIRSSPPSRRSNGVANNVCGRYPSLKMGHTIQFDSHRCELPYAYHAEHNPEILEYWEQPPPIKVTYVRDGKRMGFWYTADFAVFADSHAYYVECKPEEILEREALKKPGFFVKGEDGVWRCPPVEAVLGEKGIGFLVWTPEGTPIYARNMNFLQDYYIKPPPPVPEEIVAEVTRIVAQRRRVRLSELPSLVEGLTEDHLNLMILDKKIYVDFYSDDLPLRHNVWVYADKRSGVALSAAYACVREPIHYGPVPIEEEAGASVKWHGKVFTLKLVTDTVVYLQQGEKVVDLPRAKYDEYVIAGTIEGTTSTGEHPAIVAVKSAIGNTSNQGIEDALEKLEALKGGSTTFSGSTMRRAKRAAKLALKEKGSEIYGLLPNHSLKGNRNRRLPEALYAIADEVIADAYGTTTAPNRRAAHALFEEKCKPHEASSYKWFCKYIRSKPPRQMAQARGGRRVAYSKFGFNSRLYRDCPVHGDHPWDVGHIDHTQLDVVATLNRGGQRAWLTTFWLSYPRKLVAYYVHFAAPSKVAVMSVMRLCLWKYGRLPTNIVVDNGKEFHGRDFQMLLARKRCTVKYRPPAQARSGAALESAHHALNANLLHNLPGNSKIMRNVRQVTKGTLPANLATLELAEIERKIGAYYDIVDDVAHPALDGATPNDYYDRGMQLLGERAHMFERFDDEQFILTLPMLKHDRIVSPQGIKFMYFRYHHAILELHHGERLKVRYDPLDIRYIYVLVKGTWIQCACPLLAGLAARSEAQLKLATAGIRANMTSVIRGRAEEIARRLVGELKLMPEATTSASAQAVKMPNAVEPKKVPDMVDAPVAADLKVPAETSANSTGEKPKSPAKPTRKRRPFRVLQAVDL